ncbi:MAG: hypothetical protein ACTSWY_01400 [Promethearchaeota archaeon]
MGAGKTLSIIAGILTLAATFALTWFTDISGNAYGIGVAKNLIGLFTDTTSWASTLGGIPTWAVYIVGVGAVLILAAGVFQLIGVKSRAMAIIGSLFPLAIGVIVLLARFNVVAGIIDYLAFCIDPVDLVAGIIPYTFNLAEVSLGAYILLASGLLGLISGFMGRD